MLDYVRVINCRIIIIIIIIIIKRFINHDLNHFLRLTILIWINILATIRDFDLNQFFNDFDLL